MNVCTCVTALPQAFQHQPGNEANHRAARSHVVHGQGDKQKHRHTLDNVATQESMCVIRTVQPEREREMEINETRVPSEHVHIQYTIIIVPLLK